MYESVLLLLSVALGAPLGSFLATTRSDMREKALRAEHGFVTVTQREDICDVD